MRPINTTAMQLEELAANPLELPYTILSYTWGDGETAFRDLTNCRKYQKGLCQDPPHLMTGETGSLGRRLLHRQDWQRSNTINSVFEWYTASDACYVFVSDLGAVSAVDPLGLTPKFAARKGCTRSGR
jgi:hypothetical protein